MISQTQPLKSEEIIERYNTQKSRAFMAMGYGILFVIAGLIWAGQTHDFNLFNAHKFSPMDLALIGGGVGFAAFAYRGHQAKWIKNVFFTSLFATGIILGIAALTMQQFLFHYSIYLKITCIVLSIILIKDALMLQCGIQLKRNDLIEQIIEGQSQSLDKTLEKYPHLIWERFTLESGNHRFIDATLLDMLITIVESKQSGESQNKEIECLRVIHKHANTRSDFNIDKIPNYENQSPRERLQRIKSEPFAQEFNRLFGEN